MFHKSFVEALIQFNDHISESPTTKSRQNMPNVSNIMYGYKACIEAVSVCCANGLMVIKLATTTREIQRALYICIL